MPATTQRGTESQYDSGAHKFIRTKDSRLLTRMKFHDPEKARKWLGAWNDVGEDESVRDHFIAEIQRLEGDA